MGGGGIKDYRERTHHTIARLGAASFVASRCSSDSGLEVGLFRLLLLLWASERACDKCCAIVAGPPAALPSCVVCAGKRVLGPRVQ